MNNLLLLMFFMFALLFGVAAFAILLVAIPNIALNLVKVRLHIIPEKNKYKNFLFNKFNVVFYPSKLDEAGKEARCKLLFWMKALLVGSVMAFGALLLFEVAGRV